MRPSSGSYWLNYRINIIMQYDDPLSDSMWHPQRHGRVFVLPDSPVLFFLPYSSSQHQVQYITCFNRASHFSLAHFSLSQNGWIYQNFKKCQSKFGVFCFNSDGTWGSLVFLYLQDVLDLFRLSYDFFFSASDLPQASYGHLWSLNTQTRHVLYLKSWEDPLHVISYGKD